MMNENKNLLAGALRAGVLGEKSQGENLNC